MKKLVWLLLLSAAFGKDAPKVARVTIRSAPEKIKAALLADLVSQGFVVDSDNQYQIQLSKPMGFRDNEPPSAKEALGSVFGHSASPVDAGNHDCRVVYPIILVQSGDSTDVTMRYEQMCGHVGGDTVRQVRVNKRLIEKMQGQLDSVKEKLEK